MFQRPHFQELIKRLEEPRKFIQVLMGPRQVGKTTLVTQLTKKIKIPSAGLPWQEFLKMDPVDLF